MDNEERKQESSRDVPFTRRLNQSDSDYAIAMVLQEQERAFTMLSTIESDDSDEDESDASSENNIDNYYTFFENHDFDELVSLEGEDSSSDYDEDDMEEDDIDPDELSYEELIALGEIIGVEQRGLSLNEISTCLHPCKSQSVDRKSIDKCVICQVEYEEGEELVALPCEHSYHSVCISQWLQIKKICPICSTEVSSPKIAKNV